MIMKLTMHLDRRPKNIKLYTIHQPSTVNTYISRPHAEGQDIVLLAQVHLNQTKTECHGNEVTGVLDGTSVLSLIDVVFHDMPDEAQLGRRVTTEKKIQRFDQNKYIYFICQHSFSYMGSMFVLQYTLQ